MAFVMPFGGVVVVYSFTVMQILYRVVTLTLSGQPLSRECCGSSKTYSITVKKDAG
jgi:hypothetical protein